MGYTLDASAKIYSYRVDKVYADMMKVMSGKVFQEVEGDGESKGDEEGDEENGEATPKKKRKKNCLEDDKDLNLEKVRMVWNKVIHGHLDPVDRKLMRGL